MKTVLVVEDERMTQRTYQAGLRGLGDWNVMVMERAAEAVRVLEDTPVDVLVTDLAMPRISGHDLIRAVSTWYPGIPILVVSGVQDKALLDEALQSGALRIHPKPIRLSWLMDDIRGLGNRPPDGRTEGVPLTSMLQMLEWEKGDCTVTVYGGGKLGRLYVKDGELIQASSRGVRGIDAALGIMDLPAPRTEFTRVCRVDRAIAMPLTELLMEHSVRSDHGHMEPEKAELGPEDPWAKG